jgi:hypothetical protein
MLSCRGAEGQAQDVRLPKLSVEVLRKVYRTYASQWELDLTKAEVQRQKAFPKTKCDAEPSDMPQDLLLAKYSLDTDSILWSTNASHARLLEAQAERLALDRKAASKGAGITPSAFSESSPSSLGVIAEKLVMAEIDRLNVAHDELFERLIAFQTAFENDCKSDEYIAVSIANEAVTNELLAKAVPAQAENIRSLTKRVSLQPLLQARKKFEDRLDAARKRNPEALKAHAAAQDRRRRLEGPEFARSRTQYEAVLRTLGVMSR